MTMPTPAIWSAVAASLSAVSALLMWRIQRRNFFEASRPELVLAGWRRQPNFEGHGSPEEIFFDTVRNIGRGAAVGVRIKGDFPKNPVTAVASGNSIDILASDEAIKVQGRVSLWWKNAPADGNFISFNIYLRFVDDRGIHHETRYGLLAVQPGVDIHVTDEIAPGLLLGERSTKSMPLRRRKLFTRLQRYRRRFKLFFAPNRSA